MTGARWSPPLLRLRLLAATTVLLLALLALQALRLQVFDPLVPPTVRNGVARVIPIEAPRGLITDRNGTVLARNVPRYSVLLVPGYLPADPIARQELFMRVEQVIHVASADLQRAATTGLALIDAYAPVTVRDGISNDDAITMRAALAGVPGVSVGTSAARAYERTGALAHILGYVASLPAERAEALLTQGYSLDSRIGLAGVETQYEQALRGTPGRRLVLADPGGRVLRDVGEEPPTPGANIVLSIDLRLQRAVEAALQRGIANGLAVVRRNTGQQRPAPTPAGAAVVVDVHSGELLALVSLPSYDPNLFDGSASGDAIGQILSDPARPLVDRTYMETHAPGSIFKPLVAVAALEEGVATPNTHIFSNGALTVRDEYRPDVFYTFRDWTVHGDLDLNRAIARSSDVYFYQLAGGYSENGRELFHGLGPERLARWARAAGFGKATGLDLPGEAAGLVPDPAWKLRTTGDPWVLGDTYTFGIGQGYFTASPLQMALLAAAIANGGDVLVPRVVRGLDAGGGVAPAPARVAEQLPVSAANLAVVQRGMASAAAMADGTAATGVPNGVAIAGKTGTAEFGQAYPDGQYDTHGWYIAYAPLDHPQIAIAVYLEYGVGQTHAGPVAKEILQGYFALPNGTTTPNRAAR